MTTNVGHLDTMNLKETDHILQVGGTLLAEGAPPVCDTVTIHLGQSLSGATALAGKLITGFSLPESANWGGEMLGFNPWGDGGQSGDGAADGYPGSLFLSNINTPEAGYIGEVSIPAAVNM